MSVDNDEVIGVKRIGVYVLLWRMRRGSNRSG